MVYRASSRTVRLEREKPCLKKKKNKKEKGLRAKNKNMEFLASLR